MNKQIIPLALGGLGLGLTEYVMMGLLPDIASAQHITITQAGHLISAYALGVVIGAPLFTFLLLKKSYKSSLILLMIIFTVFNALTVVAPNYELLFMARLLSGLPHGTFFGIGALAASNISKPGKESQSVALMFSGLAIANLLGVPFGTYIGQKYSWQTTFVCIAVLGLITALAIYLWVPAVKQTKATSVKEQLTFFTKFDSWLIVSMTSIGIGGLFCWISYVSPLMTEVSGFQPKDMSFILMLAGFGMLVGNTIGGRMADQLNPPKALLYLLIMLSISLWMVFMYSSFKPLSLLLTFTTGALAYATVAPFQMVMIGAARGAAMLAASMTQAAFNLGNALGAYLGGIPIDKGYGFSYPSLIGVFMTLVGIMLTLWYVKRIQQYDSK